MCLVALIYRAIDGVPILVGANREEYYERGGDPPGIRSGNISHLAGSDPVAGGTWLGVNGRGLVVAVTNRRKGRATPPTRSRGSLVRDLLATPNAQEAVALAIQELESDAYAGCNVVCVDHQRAVVLQGSDWLRVRYLPPGIHVLTNGDINDGTDDRIVHVSSWLYHQQCTTLDHAMASLREVCAHHEPENPPICFRHPTRGTVSSSLLALGGERTFDANQSLYLHAQGPPNATEYEDYSALLRQLN